MRASFIPLLVASALCVMSSDGRRARVSEAAPLTTDARPCVAAAPAAPAEKRAEPRWEPPKTECQGYRRHAHVTRSAVPCPSSTVDEVRAWRPDALVVLGGGVLSSGDPNCATTQRGYLASQLDEALASGAPALVLTGNGNESHARTLDEADAACVRARTLQQEGDPGVLRGKAALVAPGVSRVMTEAEAMCAVLLRRTEPSRREAVLARVVFETRARTTAQNATRTRPLLAEGGYRRVLVLTSPVVHRHGRGVDVHADRAFEAFRQVRRGGEWALGAVGCPITRARGLSTFARFE